MKKKQLLLAMLIASSVVACSSSDDGDDDAARRAAEEKAAAEKAAAEKAAAEAAAKKKAAEEAAKKKAAEEAAKKKAAEEAAKKKAAEEAAKKAAEEAAKKKAAQIAGVIDGNVSAGTDLITDDIAKTLTAPGSKPGHLITSNRKSNFIVNDNTATTSDASKALEMTRQNLNERLDTIVVAYPHKEGDKTLGYLEDFEFRTNGDGNVAHTLLKDTYDKDKKNGGDYDGLIPNATTGLASMNNIFVTKGTNGGKKRDDNRGTTSATKTETEGKTGHELALVYQDGRYVYFGDETKRFNNGGAAAVDTAALLTKVGQDKKGNDILETLSETVEARTPRGLQDTVAEVYGTRTFVKNLITGAEGSPEKYTGYGTNGDIRLLDPIGDSDQNNLPLVDLAVKDAKKLAGKDYKLDNVQYGRVTSQLHDANMNNYKNGVEDNTKVVGYGRFGADGTEDVYFYRGLNNTTGKQLAAARKEGGKLAYHGHAVSYGLDNRYTGGAAGSRPNAIGGVPYDILSGNHVYGELDLATGEFSNGEIYNVWVKQQALAENMRATSDAEKSLSKLNDKDKLRVALVKFDGTLDNMGNITGDATRLTHASANEGTFNATLYGADVGELGGAVASVDQSAKNKWGAVFAAKSTGIETGGNPWAAATDENNNGKVE